MDLHLTSVPELLRKPSGFIPLVMSPVALALLLGFIAAVLQVMAILVTFAPLSYYGT